MNPAPSTLRPAAANADSADDRNHRPKMPTRFEQWPALRARWSTTAVLATYRAPLRSARGEEFGVRRDSIGVDLHNIDEFGGDRDAGDFGKNIRAPVCDRTRHLDREAQQLIVVDPEDLDHHGEPRSKLGEILGPNGDRLVGACAQNFVPALIGKSAEHAGKIPAHACCMQLLDYSFRDDALGHVFLLKMGSLSEYSA